MNIRRKKYSVLMLSFVVLGALFTGCTDQGILQSAANPGNTPSSHLHGSFSIDVHDPKAVVGDADHVFVGRVDKLIDTEYKNPVKMETENGTKVVSSPYTNYSITVLDNIKGELEKDTSIPVQKSGGITEDESTYMLYEDDQLPKVNEVYVFMAYVQKDGSLLVSGPNSNIQIPAGKNVQKNNAQSFAETKEYSTYLKAYQNEIKNDRQRFSSPYETQVK